MHDAGDRRLNDDANLVVHHQNGYSTNEIPQQLFKSETVSNNNDSLPMETGQGTKGASPENLPNENCSNLCGIVPVSSLEAAMEHHQQLATSANVLTAANPSSLDDMSVSFEAQHRYWMTQTFPPNNYNSLLFAQPDWIYHQQHHQTQLLQHHQLQQDSLMTVGQMNGCASNNPHFMPFYGLSAADTSHNPMLFIQPPSIQPVGIFV